jgi:hypothetical protein
MSGALKPENEAALLEVVKAARHLLHTLGAQAAVNPDTRYSIAVNMARNGLRDQLANLDRLNP